MDYLTNNKDELKTPLKFDCPKCGESVVSHYLRIGEELKCPHCRKAIAVPESAAKTEEDSNVLDIWRTEKISPTQQRKPTGVERIKNKYKKIHILSGVIIALVLVFALQDIIANEIYRMLISVIIGYLVSYTISTFEKQEKDSKPNSELEKEIK